MPGTKAGAAKAQQTLRARYGDDFYKRIGSKGGKSAVRPELKGFGSLGHDAAVKAGRKGAKARFPYIAPKWLREEGQTHE